MNEMTIKKADFSHSIKKSDVLLVFLNSGKCWVCELNGMRQEGDFIVLTLATKAGAK